MALTFTLIDLWADDKRIHVNGHWRRLRRNALWFVVGAGAGAAASYAAGR
jgi:hypothetical protein